MDPLRTIALQDGYFTRADALRAGFDDQAIRRAMQRREWQRVRPGSYTFRELWVAADDLGRHRVASHAVARKLGDRVALSHVSAAAHHELDLLEPDLSAVHVTRTDGGAGRTGHGVVHHEGFCGPGDVIVHHGVRLINRPRVALEAAGQGDVEAAVVVLDSALRSGCTIEEIGATHDLMRAWPGHRRVDVAVRLADGRAASVGESRARVLCWSQHLPAPQLQFEVRDGRGTLVGTTDFAWPSLGLLGEFDGRVKYGRLLKPGEDAGDVVFREKLREDLLREVTGWRMVRLVWADLYRLQQTAARIRRLMAGGDPRVLPVPSAAVLPQGV
jgi:hypothetical protein